MIKLSEIIKTDCYIDCGSNEKLREVMALINIPIEFKVFESDKVLACMVDFAYTLKNSINDEYPTIHISQINLNQ
jgi:hypothetical protein